MCVAAFLLAPTVASVHQKVEDLNFQRDTGIHLFKWWDEPTPNMPFPDCGGGNKDLYSEITRWPPKIRKDEPFELLGVVQSEQDGRTGVGTIEVDIFLNETKTEPGIFLGRTESNAGGQVILSTSVPFDLEAQHYHIVMHAKQKRIGCQLYREHWSDPEVDVLSGTAIVLAPPEHPVVGRAVELDGRLLDAVGAPVRNATVNFTIAGKTTKLTTDEGGAFKVPYTPDKAGNVTYSAEFKGSRFYDPSKNETKMLVAEEAFVLDVQTIAILRSQATTLTGHVYVADSVRKPTFTIDFDGINVTTCPECAPADTHEVPLGEDGAFSFTFTVPDTEPAGVHSIDVSGGGLKKSYTYSAALDVPAVLTVEADGVGLFSRGYEARVTLADEAGRPLAALPVATLTPNGWVENATASDGTLALSGSSDCGARTVQARFNGTAGIRPAEAQDEVLVCGFLAFIPSWLLAVPWWVWPLALLAALVAWQLARGWRQRYAPIITGGPALTVLFTEPADDAAGYATIGEAIVATAFLAEPLPDGHRLRMGMHGGTEELPLDAELRAHLRIVPDKLGPIHVRAEVVDPKGRVVSRRTAQLKVVRYAEEIEHRYLALRAEHGASEAVTPREFERWLHERAPGLDPALARRLVHVFEEADYSPRVAGRAEFAAYLAAEGGVQEVAADATLA